MASDDTPNGESFPDYIQRIETTAGKQKLWSYVKGLSDDGDFIQTIAKLREKYGLPKHGMTEYQYYTSERNGQEYISLPESVNKGELWKDMLALAEGLALDSLWADTLQHYVVYNNWDMSSMGSMFTALDVHNLLNGPFPEFSDEATELDLAKDFAKTYPIALLFSPYASQRDIIDYIKKSYKAEIEPLQKVRRDAKIKIGKMRKRNERVQRRNAFIRANAHLPYKEIVRIIADETGEVLDYTYIAKIIGSKKKK